MTRNLKALGLALVAVFAMTAVLASAAQAAEGKVTVSSSPAWLTAESIAHPSLVGTSERFKLPGGQIVACEKNTAAATVKNGDVSITLVPKFENCSATVGTETLKVTVTMNDCDFLLHDMTTETPNSTTFTALVDLVCPVGKEVEIHLWKDAAETQILCTYFVPPFVNLGGNVIHNEAGTPNDLKITHTVTGIKTTRTGSLLCGGASQEATFTGSTTIKAFEDLGGTIKEGTVENLVEGKQVSLTISD